MEIRIPPRSLPREVFLRCTSGRRPLDLLEMINLGQSGNASESCLDCCPCNLVLNVHRNMGGSGDWQGCRLFIVKLWFIHVLSVESASIIGYLSCSWVCFFVFSLHL